MLIWVTSFKQKIENYFTTYDAKVSFSSIISQFFALMSWPKSIESIFPPLLELGEVKNLWIMHLKVSNTATFKKLSFHQFSSSLWIYFLKSKTPSVIPLWRPFLMPMKGARSKVPHSGHFRWLSQCQDWFTKSCGHARSLKLATWNFAW